MSKSQERILSEQIQVMTGSSLIKINSDACQLVDMGLAKTRLEALEHLLEMLESA